MSNFLKQSAQKGFTLIELIIVITILVILGVVVVVLIDPAEILAQSRDSQRISDLASIKGATQLVLSNAVPANASTVCRTDVSPENGSNASSSIYVSLSSAGSSGYVTTSAATLQNASTTGWIKMNFTGLSTGNALSGLPIDPTNSYSASGLYYRWGCNYNSNLYQYEVDASLESAKYKPSCTASNCDDKSARDGGNSATRYETGNNLNVLPATF